MSLISHKLVPPAANTGEYMMVKVVGQDPMPLPLAKVAVQVADLQETLTVPVCDTLKDPILVGLDIRVRHCLQLADLAAKDLEKPSTQARAEDSLL